jgi:hypothetical protein
VKPSQHGLRIAKVDAIVLVRRWSGYANAEFRNLWPLAWGIERDGHTSVLLASSSVSGWAGVCGGLSQMACRALHDHVVSDRR